MARSRCAAAAENAPLSTKTNPLADGFRRRLADVVGIVDDDSIASFARSCATHSQRDAAAGFVVLKTVLLVLVAGQQIPITPSTLIERTFDQPPAFQSITDGEASCIACQ